MSITVEPTKKQLKTFAPLFRLANEAYARCTPNRDMRGVIWGQFEDYRFRCGFFSHKESLIISKALKEIYRARKAKAKAKAKK
jgi:hypothetical protein